MKSISIEVNDFTVVYRQAQYGTDVEVYVDGNLNESSQYTWYLRELLDETIRLKEESNKWKSAYKELKKDDEKC